MPSPLEILWKQIPKEIHNGKEYIHYRQLDVPYLYLMRMADPHKCTLQQWMDAFNDSRQADGSYLVSHEQFVAKMKYYNATIPTRAPFDANSLRQGYWDEKDLDEVYFTRIREETVLTDVDWEEVKRRIRQKDGRLMIDKDFVRELCFVLEKFPSVIRNRATNMMKLKETQKETGFTAGQADSLEAQKKLKHLLVKRP